MKAAYLDTSAAVKLVIAEGESEALRVWLRGRLLTSSALLRVELIRAVMPRGSAAVERGARVLAQLELIRIGRLILDRASQLEPPNLRTLDAIHLASAELISTAVLVSYDGRLTSAAAQRGLAVASPV
ncbi:MAG: type II toxin-antitoxin system VapC family toxin [Candidatus Dormibacteraeota bacterium]|nr:type II toxin-antitoxin system VapC family toxin [Candidatus Dormibacteraeota bacterium]